MNASMYHAEPEYACIRYPAFLLKPTEDLEAEFVEYGPAPDSRTVHALCVRLDKRRSQPRVPVRAMIQTYEEAAGTCIGCD